MFGVLSLCVCVFFVVVFFLPCSHLPFGKNLDSKRTIYFEWPKATTGVKINFSQCNRPTRDFAAGLERCQYRLASCQSGQSANKIMLSDLTIPYITRYKRNCIVNVFPYWLGIVQGLFLPLANSQKWVWDFLHKPIMYALTVRNS